MPSHIFLVLILGVIRGFSSFSILSVFQSLSVSSKLDEFFFQPFWFFFGGCLDQSFYFEIDTPFVRYNMTTIRIHCALSTNSTFPNFENCQRPSNIDTEVVKKIGYKFVFLQFLNFVSNFGHIRFAISETPHSLKTSNSREDRFMEARWNGCKV